MIPYSHDAQLQRIAALYLPLAAAFLTGLLQPRHPRRFAACLLSAIWVAVTLLVLQSLNEAGGWWTFTSHGMPLELYFGWIVLWGILPQLAFPRLDLAWVLALMGFLDIVSMPLCRALVHLNDRWLTGESIAILLVLAPALCLARWTRNATRLRARAALQLVLCALLVLFFLPGIVFTWTRGSWRPLLNVPRPALQIELQLLALLALPGVSALAEFIETGHGTPIPFDPPTRLVTTGIYRYLANPMQLSCALVMLAWAALLRSPWFAAAAIVSLIYSAGIAVWDEDNDLDRRFGAPWRRYRIEVRNWRPRWRPYHAGPPAHLYLARTCGPCSQLRAWLESCHPIGLEFVDAESLPPNSIRRMRYVAATGESVDGIRALGRALEHLNLAWALCGAALRLPLLWRFFQALADAAGFGPRTIQCNIAPGPTA